MPGATLPSTDAVATWTDNFDNWRAVDADFLQKRAILRFTSTTARNNILGPSGVLAAPAQGQFSYVGDGGVDANGGLEYVDATGSWRSCLSVKNLGVTDTSGAFGMRLNSDSSAVVSLETEQVVLGRNRALIVAGDKLIFKTGATEVEITTDATSVHFNKPLSTAAASLGNVTTTSIDNTGGTLATASVAATGNITAGTLTSGDTTLEATSVASLTSESGVTGVTVYGSTSVRASSLLLSGSRLANYGAAAQYVELVAGTATVGGDTLILAPTAATSAVRFRTPSGPPFALVVLSATDPGLGNYPDGTFWVQP